MDSILDMMTRYALAGYIKEKCQEMEKNFNSWLNEYGIIGKITIECQIDGIDTETFLQKAKEQATQQTSNEKGNDVADIIDNFYKEKKDNDD